MHARCRRRSTYVILRKLHACELHACNLDRLRPAPTAQSVCARSHASLPACPHAGHPPGQNGARRAATLTRFSRPVPAPFWARQQQQQQQQQRLGPSLRPHAVASLRRKWSCCHWARAQRRCCRRHASWQVALRAPDLARAQTGARIRAGHLLPACLENGLSLPGSSDGTLRSHAPLAASSLDVARLPQHITCARMHTQP